LRGFSERTDLPIPFVLAGNLTEKLFVICLVTGAKNHTIDPNFAVSIFGHLAIQAVRFLRGMPVLPNRHRQQNNGIL
jgi:hypothetical protein